MISHEWGKDREVLMTKERRVWRYQRAIRICKSKKDRQHNGQKKKDKYKQRSTKHYKEKRRMSDTNPTTTRSELTCSGRVSSTCSTSGTRKCCSSCKAANKSWMRKGPGSAYDKWKQSLKIPKWQSGSVNRRRTDSTMVKRKRIGGQTTINKTLHRKLKIKQHEPQ